MKLSRRRRAGAPSFWFAPFLIVGVSVATSVSAVIAPPHAFAGETASQVSSAPLNPAFVQRQHQTPQLLDTDALVHPLGYVPAPVRPSDYSAASLSGRPPLRALPSSFDLRSQSKVSGIKDQNPWGTCWTFATYGSMESSLLPGALWDFSEHHLALTSGFDYEPYDGGGHEYMSCAYLARDGAIGEADDPYGEHAAPSGLVARERLQAMEIIWNGSSTSAGNDAIKSALYSYGALYTAFYWNSAYYNSATAAYYYPSSTSVGGNHAVTIVGWDDNYSATNFRSGTRPSANGAWLIKNSWGTAWGQSGYFWLSYSDSFAGTSAIRFVGEPVGTYRTNYQYDQLGWVTAWHAGTASTNYAANDFTATNSDQLSAVGFYTADPGTTVDVYTSSSHTGTRTLQATVTEATAGYHTVSLSSPVNLSSGQAFSVIIRFTCPAGLDPMSWWPVCAEAPVAGYSSGATAGSGQSWVSSTGSSWTDMSLLSPTSNACIKAFAKPAASDTSAPTTGMSGQPSSGWSKTPVTLTFSPTDGSGWGVLFTEASLDSTILAQVPSRSITVSGEGNHTVRYRSVDAAGNVEGTRTASVGIDTVAPTTTVQNVPAGWINHDVTVMFSATDSASGVNRTEYSIDGGSTWSPAPGLTFSGQGTATVQYRAVDNAGNVETAKSFQIKIDASAPTTSASSPPADWSKTPVTITFSAVDPGSYSGVNHTEISFNNGSTWTNIAGTSVTIAAQGTFTMYYRSVDNAGNVENRKGPVTIKVDGTPPTTGIANLSDPNGWHNTDFSVSLQATDGGAGVSGTWFALNGGAFAPYSVPFVISTEGVTKVSYYSSDAIGNTESGKSTEIRIDKTPPAATIAGVPTGWSRPVSVTLSGTDALSGLAGVRYSTDGGATWATAAAPAQVKIAAEGVSTLTYSCIDAAGNLAPSQQASFSIDATGPKTKALKNVVAVKGKKATFRFSATDRTPTAKITIKIFKRKGLKKVIAVGSKQMGKALTYTWKKCTLAKGRYTWKVYAVDEAGNAQAAVGNKTLTVK